MAKKYKMKTKKALAKRVKRTASGEMKVAHAFRSHLAHGKTTKQKRHARKATLMHPSDKQRVKNLIQD